MEEERVLSGRMVLETLGVVGEMVVTEWPPMETLGEEHEEDLEGSQNAILVERLAISLESALVGVATAAILVGQEGVGGVHATHVAKKGISHVNVHKVVATGLVGVHIVGHLVMGEPLVEETKQVRMQQALGLMEVMPMMQVVIVALTTVQEKITWVKGTCPTIDLDDVAYKDV